MEHGNAKTANAFPIASKSSNNNAEGDKLDEDWSKHVPTPVAALTHAINAMDHVRADYPYNQRVLKTSQSLWPSDAKELSAAPWMGRYKAYDVRVMEFMERGH